MPPTIRFVPALQHGAEDNKARSYTLLLAVIPDDEAAQRIVQTTAALRRRLGLTGELIPPERLHITLHGLAGGPEPPVQTVVDAALSAAAAVHSCPMPPIVFDRVLRFMHSQAVVLRSDAAGDAAIARLRQMLALLLRRRQLRPESSSTPHMTMLYDRQRVAEQPLESTLQWTATHFALILSHVGHGYHQRIEQWPLTTTTTTTKTGPA